MLNNIATQVSSTKSRTKKDNNSLSSTSSNALKMMGSKEETYRFKHLSNVSEIQHVILVSVLIQTNQTLKNKKDKVFGET